jgi:hypothetical protein
MTEDNLVKRLNYWIDEAHRENEWSDLMDVRYRIEALTAENERLKREVLLQMGWKTEAQKRLALLEEALEFIATEGGQTESRVAFAALEGKQ